MVSHNGYSGQKQHCLANKLVFKNICWKCLCLVPEKETKRSCSIAQCTADETGWGQVVRVCPFTYFQAHTWENTVLPKEKYLVCACILLALWINDLCQGRSASSPSWETPLFPCFVCSSAMGKAPGSPFQLTLAVPHSTLVQTLRFLWCSFSFCSPKRTCSVRTEN